jgi:methyltransferase (TIGR00027 family)
LNMEENQAGITAVITAYSRAYHSTHDEPKILDDDLAMQLFAPQERAFIEKNLSELIKFVDPELAAHYPQPADALAWVMQNLNAPITLCRSRYAEDCLQEAVKRGVSQYIILGAGLDTFAFPRPDWTAGLRVFEVDHPTTQAMKRQRVASAGWAEPAQLHYVPVDFSSTDLTSALKDSAYDPIQLSFFSWLGVTYYLTESAITKTLCALSGLAPSGSQIVFDYFEKGILVNAPDSAMVRSLTDIVRQTGEPMKTGFEPAELAAWLGCTGNHLIEDLGPEEIEAKYFKGRADGYHAAAGVHIARAAVA